MYDSDLGSRAAELEESLAFTRQSVATLAAATLPYLWLSALTSAGEDSWADSPATACLCSVMVEVGLSLGFLDPATTKVDDPVAAQLELTDSMLATIYEALVESRMIDFRVAMLEASTDESEGGEL